MEQKITYNELPDAISRIEAKLDDLNNYLIEREDMKPTNQNELLSIQEASKFLHLTIPTIYTKTSKGELPGVCKKGKRLFFDKQVLTDWIRSGRKLSNDEIQANPETLLKKKGGNDE